jgi:hypothetical protein
MESCGERGGAFELTCPWAKVVSGKLMLKSNVAMSCLFKGVFLWALYENVI